MYELVKWVIIDFFFLYYYYTTYQLLSLAKNEHFYSTNDTTWTFTLKILHYKPE